MIVERGAPGNGAPRRARLGAMSDWLEAPRRQRARRGALLLAFALVACTTRSETSLEDRTAPPRVAGLPLETKPWHVSAEEHASDLSSTKYPEIAWSVVEKLYPGMYAARARELLGDLQSYHHPVNAIAFARNPAEGWRYEIALKLSADGTFVEDLSFKHVERTPAGDYWPEESEGSLLRPRRYP